MLDEKGRCCGRKPMVYKSSRTTSTGPHRYCPRCDRAYDLEENEQIPNWAWKLIDGRWQRQTNGAYPTDAALNRETNNRQIDDEFGNSPRYWFGLLSVSMGNQSATEAIVARIQQHARRNP